jgi:exonuclease SbcD
VDWRKLEDTRPFLDRFVRLETEEAVTEQLRTALPSSDDLTGAIVRLVIEYPRDWETLIDEAALREYTAECFEFHLVRRPQSETRIRLPGDHTIGSLTPLELLDLYWRASHIDQNDVKALNEIAAQMMRDAHEGL